MSLSHSFHTFVRVVRGITSPLGMDGRHELAKNDPISEKLAEKRVRHGRRLLAGKVSCSNSLNDKWRRKTVIYQTKLQYISI